MSARTAATSHRTVASDRHTAYRVGTDAGSGQTVLVTGAAGGIGSALLDALRATPGIGRVVGADTSGTRRRTVTDGLVHVDLRTPSIARLVAETAPDTVVHLGVTAGPTQAGGRAAMKERNVIGTMQLLAACQKARGVRRLVMRSSSAVYGSAPRDPALFAENTAPHRQPSSGYGKDVVEAEEYVRGFARRRPDVDVTVLRFAPMLGPGGDSPLHAYLGLPVLPTILGYDPRLQFVHAADAVEALRLAVAGARPGTYNIAGAGTLLLSQVARRLERPVLPIPPGASGMLGRALRTAGLVDFTSDQLALLTYGRVLDTTAMRVELGLRPTHSTAATLDAYLTSGRGWVMPATDRLLATIDRLQDWLGERDARRARPEAEGPSDRRDTRDVACDGRHPTRASGRR
jgi:UDP-glucose 4-epimerase